MISLDTLNGSLTIFGVQRGEITEYTGSQGKHSVLCWRIGVTNVARGLSGVGKLSRHIVRWEANSAEY